MMDIEEGREERCAHFPNCCTDVQELSTND